MHQQEIPITRDVIYSLLQGCTKKKDLSVARPLHSLMIRTGFDSISVLQDHLIRLFAVCGSLLDARDVFCKITQPSVHTWHSIISAHTKLGENETALELYHRMRQTGAQVEKIIFVPALKACGNLGSPCEGRLVHDQIIESGLDSDLILGNALLGMYAKCGSLEDARKLFDQMSYRDVVSWNAMIAGFVQHGHGQLPLELFLKMKQEGIQPCKITYSCILKACGLLGNLSKGKIIHEQTVKSGFESDVVIGNTIVDMYAKCCSLEEAHRVFDELTDQTIVSWGAIIAGYTSLGHGFCALALFNNMQQEGVKPNRVIFSCVLKACSIVGATEQGMLVHDQLLRSGLESEEIIGNTLIDMYVKCESVEEAHNVFDNLPKRDRVSWNSMIAGYAQQGHDFLALELFEKMQKAGIQPCEVLLLCILKTCGSIGAICQGRLLHQDIIKRGFESDVVIGNTLVDMYAKCGSLEEAHRVFENLPDCSVVSFGAMIAAYVVHGHSLAALKLSATMQQKGREPNDVIYLSVLKACGSLGDIGQGRFINDQISRSGFESDFVVSNALIDMYAKCKGLEDMQNIFDRMQIRDVVSWGAIIDGYAKNGDDPAALELFENMQEEGIQPNRVIFLLTLRSCGGIGAVDQGRLIHAQIIKNGMESDGIIGTSLIDMYANCGSLEEAHKILKEFPSHEAASWNALISGYSQNGNWKLAVQSFEDMQQQGLKPDSWTFTSILAACSHAGKVAEGHWYFKSMQNDHGITPTIEHLNCMVDLLARVGHLDEAEQFLHSMPVLPNITGWLALLTGCRTFGNIERAKQCFSQAVQFDPDSASGYMLMSNVYANAHMWEDVCNIHQRRKFAGAWKKPGMVWIEVNNKPQEFLVGNKTHTESDKLYAKFSNAKRQIKDLGYVPELDLVSEPELCELSEGCQ